MFQTKDDYLSALVLREILRCYGIQLLAKLSWLLAWWVIGHVLSGLQSILIGGRTLSLEVSYWTLALSYGQGDKIKLADTTKDTLVSSRPTCNSGIEAGVCTGTLQLYSTGEEEPCQLSNVLNSKSLQGTTSRSVHPKQTRTLNNRWHGQKKLVPGSPWDLSAGHWVSEWAPSAPAPRVSLSPENKLLLLTIRQIDGPQIWNRTTTFWKLNRYLEKIEGGGIQGIPRCVSMFDW